MCLTLFDAISHVIGDVTGGDGDGVTVMVTLMLVMVMVMQMTTMTMAMAMAMTDSHGYILGHTPGATKNAQQVSRFHGFPLYKNGKRGDAGTSQRSLLAVMVFMFMFNVSSLPLMSYVVGVLGLFSP